MTSICTKIVKRISSKAAVVAGCGLVALSVSTPLAADPAVTASRHAISLSQIELSEQATCLAQNIYFEARSEPVDGMLAVGHVVLNRVASKRFPDTICQVIRQGGEQRLHRCQFSWWCDGRSDKPVNKVAWNAARVLAWFIYHGHTVDPTEGALWYHADYVNPSWREAFVAGPQIGRHIFYRNGDGARS